MCIRDSPWVFAPAWIFLYITIFTALLLFTVTRTRRSKVLGYTYFIIQAVLNILWTPSFFILNNPTLALIDIIAPVSYTHLEKIRFQLSNKLLKHILSFMFGVKCESGL